MQPTYLKVYFLNLPEGSESNQVIRLNHLNQKTLL